MLVAPQHSPGRLAENVMHFARVLRSAGIAVGTDRVQLALQALRIAGFDSRPDFHAVLSTCLLDRIEHKDLFDQAFELFWRDPDLEGRMRAMLLPKVRAQAALTPEQRENRRLGDALFPNPRSDAPQPEPDESMQFDAAFTVHTLYFWPEPERQLAEAHRVLRAGGRLVLGFRERTDDAVRRFPPPTYRFDSTDEVTAMLSRAGFAAPEIRSASAGADLRIAVARRPSR
jgi:hypothetical protein